MRVSSLLAGWCLYCAVISACGHGGGPATPRAGAVVVGAPSMALQWRHASNGFATDPAARAAWRIRAVDVDGDGDRDVHFGSAMFRNLGAGAFDPIAIPNASSRTFAFGDLDGDGDQDLIGARSVLQVWTNDGHGGFTDASAQWLGDAVAADDVALGDLDGDGDPDLVVAGARDRVLRNDGSAFVDVSATWLVGNPPSSTATTLVLADFDGDGDLDLLSQDGTRLFRNQGTALVADATVQLPAATNAAIAVADLEGDGDLDLLVSSALPFPGPPHRLLRNDGTGHFLDATNELPTNPGTSLEVAGAALGDVDGDGDVDIVFSLSEQLLRNRGDGTFAVDATLLPIPYCHAQCCLFDADGDGDLDLATAAGASVECVLPAGRTLLVNDGTGRFDRVPTAVEAPPGTFADLDGDGHGDLIDAYQLYRGGTAGDFTPNQFAAVCSPSPPPVPSHWGHGQLLLARDLDGDGAVDFVFAASGAIHRNVGGFHWQATDNPTTPGASAAAALDVDADGDLDLVVGRRDDAVDLPLVLLRNEGNGRFVEDSARLPVAGYHAGAIAAADADGDGDADLVVLSVRTGEARFQLLRNVGGEFTVAGATPLSRGAESTRAIALADLDRDGRAEVLVAGDASACLFVQRSDGTFVNESDRLALPPSTTMQRVVANDLDGDGDLDLATQSDEQRVFLQDAPLQFRADDAARFAFPRDPGTFVVLPEQLTDIDGDGDLDLGARRNLTRQLRFVGLPRIGRTLTMRIYAQPEWLPSPRLARVFVELASSAPLQALPQGNGLWAVGTDAVELPTVTIRAPAGQASVDLPVPDLPALVGAELRAQAVLIDPAGQSGATNRERATIGR